MSAHTKLFQRLAVAISSVILLTNAAQSAGISTIAKLDTNSVADNRVLVGGKYTRKYDRYGRSYYRADRNHVDAPYTSYKRRGRVEVDAPYAYVRRDRGGVRVRAPYVDLYIPGY